MRRFGFSLSLLLAMTAPVCAQVTAEVILDQEQFLPGEALTVAVRITNRSGQTLELGAANDWLTFSVASRDGYSVPQLREVPLKGEFTLESASVATRRVDLMPYFDFGYTASYSIAATLKVPGWEKEFASKPALVEVVRGTKIWEQEFGVPAEKGVPEARKYILQQARFLKQLLLYARVTTLDESHTFRVFPVGPLVGFSRPEAQVDKESKLHLLFQTGARSFSYSVIRPDGDLLLHQSYDYSGSSRPVLKAATNGFIFVSGGARRLTAEESTRLIQTQTNEARSVKP